MAEVTHAIRVAAHRTGLSPHVIRIWEKRYGAVEPGRTTTNRRLYTEAEIERLNCLRRATELGHSIGLVARLSMAQLNELVVTSHASEAGRAASQPTTFERGHLTHCLEAIKNLDASTFEQALERASLDLGSQGVLRKLIAPLAQNMGSLWRQGELTAAHEHFATAIIRTFLGSLSRPYALPESAPVLVVATPAGQLHELGAVIVAAAAATQGWRVMYVGAGLPAAEIAGVVRQARASAVALSIVYPTDDPALAEELKRLRSHLPPDLPILVGGRAAGAYGQVLEQIGASCARDLDELYSWLEQLRAGT